METQEFTYLLTHSGKRAAEKCFTGSWGHCSTALFLYPKPGIWGPVAVETIMWGNWQLSSLEFSLEYITGCKGPSLLTFNPSPLSGSEFTPSAVLRIQECPTSSQAPSGPSKTTSDHQSTLHSHSICLKQRNSNAFINGQVRSNVEWIWTSIWPVFWCVLSKKALRQTQGYSPSQVNYQVHRLPSKQCVLIPSCNILMYEEHLFLWWATIVDWTGTCFTNILCQPAGAWLEELLCDFCLWSNIFFKVGM